MLKTNNKYSANNFSTFINVSGFRQVLSNITYTLLVDESQRLAQLKASRTGVTVAVGDSFNYNDFKIPSEYRPTHNKHMPIGRNAPQILNYVWADGTVGIYNTYSNAWTGFDFSFMQEWHY